MEENRLTTLQASQLANPQPRITLPPAKTAQSPASFASGFGSLVDSGNQAIVRAETEETRQRDDILGKLLSNEPVSSQGVFQDTFNTQARTLGYKDGQTLSQQLRDANTGLARLQGTFNTQEARVQDLAGTQGAKVGLLGEISREEAVQVGNQALLVQALQGNYNTAVQIARDTANFAVQDRQAELQNLVSQYNAIQPIVSGQEAQIIEQRKADALQESQELDRTQATVDAAIASGVATPEEMQQLTTPLESTKGINDDTQLAQIRAKNMQIMQDKQALANAITSRGAVENRAIAEEDRQFARESEMFNRGIQQQQLDISRGNLAVSQQNANRLEEAASFDRLIEKAKLGDTNALKELGISIEPSEFVQVDQKEAASLEKEMVNNDEYKKMKKATDSLRALKAYEDKFKEFGTTSGVTSPFDNSKLKTVYNAATLNLKEFFNLGVLNGPDLEVIQSTLGNPTDQGFITNPGAKGASQQGLTSMYSQIADTIDDSYLSLRSQYGKYGADQITSLDDLDRQYIQNKALIDPQVEQLVNDNPNMPVDDLIQIINGRI